MLTDEQIEVGADWWAQAIARSYTDEFRVAFKASLAKHVKSASESRPSKFDGTPVMVYLDTKPNVVLLMALADVGVRGHYQKVLPLHTEMAFHEDGRVLVRVNGNPRQQEVYP